MRAPDQRRPWCALLSVVLFAAGLALAARPAEPVPAAPPAARTAVRPVPVATRPAGLPRSVPVLLDIPAAGIRTALTPVGLNPDGTLAMPPPTRTAPAGWYRHLAAPGEIGTAVIAGHVDSARFGPAVFYRLRVLRPGDAVTVRRADGATARFLVTATKWYAKNRFPAEAVYGPANHAALRLITCGGSFDRRAGHYRDVLVVYAAAH
ncbi:class F sortase [Actinoplanes sp. NPDC024001]|uniref:class F sortase n=1 Tax=Actinoplanes sp. NPDC024001 TaxID=3154598 RepID=UPI0033FCEAAD